MTARLFVLPILAVGLLAGQEFTVGSKVGDFDLKNLQGQAVPFSSLRGDVTVITFISVQCPVSNAYNERMNALYSDYSGKGVNFVFVNANRTEPAAEVAAHAQRVGFQFPVYKDDDNVVADRFGASVTPESFVIDKTGKLVYHGSIDDSQEVRRVQTQRLRNALDEVLAGKAVQTAETKAFGCTIKRVKKAS